MKDKEDVKNSLVATEEDLLAIGASLPSKTEERTKYKSFNGNAKDTNNAPIIYEDDKPTMEPSKGTQVEQRESDFQYTRTNLYNIIEKSSDALSHLVQIAGQSQHPRAFEVLATLVKTIADANAELVKLHASKQKMDTIESDMSPEQPSGGNVTNNNLFIGTTAELDEIIKQMKERKNG